MFIYNTQKGKWLCDLTRKAGTILSTRCLRKLMKLKTYPTLNSIRAGRYSYHRKLYVKKDTPQAKLITHHSRKC